MKGLKSESGKGKIILKAMDVTDEAMVNKVGVPRSSSRLNFVSLFNLVKSVLEMISTPFPMLD
jgi:hypothetical protein